MAQGSLMRIRSGHFVAIIRKPVQSFRIAKLLDYMAEFYVLY